MKIFTRISRNHHAVMWRVLSLVVALFAALSLTFAPVLAPDFNLAPVFAEDDDDDDDDKDKDRDRVKIVKCDKGETIAKALKKGHKRKSLVINVRGTCTENVIITRDDVILQGDPDDGGTVIADDPTLDTIKILAARRVVIKDLTILEGSNGVNGEGGADFTVQNSIIRDSAGDGVRVAGSSAVIVDNQIMNSGGEGVNVVNSANACIGLTRDNKAGPNTIAGSTQEGIQISNGSAGTIFGNIVKENGITTRLPGIGCFRAVCRLIGGNVIRGNFFGVLINDNGALFQGPLDRSISTTSRDTIEENMSTGIFAINNASVRILDAAITDNGGNGILLNLHSTLRIRNSDILENSGSGILLFRDSAVSLENPVVSIAGNSLLGIQCSDTESSFAGNTSGVMDNTIFNVDPNCTDFNQVGMMPPGPAP